METTRTQWFVWTVGTAFILCSGSPSPSFWGKKAVFFGQHCSSGHWKLAEGLQVPALEELTVCVELYRQINTQQWTAFVYKRRGETGAEMGLVGFEGALKAWLFGGNWPVQTNLPLHNWHTVCLTWSGRTRDLRVYVNSSAALHVRLNETEPGRPRLLAPNGSLTLGASHAFLNGHMTVETGTNLLGEVTQFRMWGRELDPGLLASLSCPEGEVVGWDARDWDTQRCPPQPDASLQCDGIISGTTVLVSKAKRNSRVDCSVFVIVTPGTDVGEVQAEISTLLSSHYVYNDLKLASKPSSIRVKPVDALPSATPLPSDATVRTTALSVPVSNTLTDTFYSVVLNAVVTGSSRDPAETILIWLRGALQGDRMFVLNFALLTEAHRDLSPGFQLSTPGVEEVQATTSFLNASETERQICSLLSKTYTNGSVSVRAPPEKIQISRIEPGSCPEESELTQWGQYRWPVTEPQHTSMTTCEGDPTQVVTRFCEVSAKTEKATWTSANLQYCPLVVTNISVLEKINVTANNSADVVDIIGGLIKNSTDLLLPHLITVLGKLLDVVKVSLMTPSLADDIIAIIADILDSGSDLLPVTNEILNITDSIGDKILFDGVSHNITAPSLALALVNVNSTQFAGLTFGVSSFSHGLDPKVFINQEILDDTVAFISLPPVIEQFFPQGNDTQPRVQFQFYGTADLFQDPRRKMELHTCVVSASVTNATGEIKDLKQLIRVTLQHRVPNLHSEDVLCVYWDFKSNGDRGGWETGGCTRNSTSANHTTCLCDHLTHFAVLLDVSRSSVSKRDEQILSVISYLGCGISSTFLGVSLLTYIAFEKLRRDYPSKILINLSLALLGLNLVFLVNSWLSSFESYGLCIAVASIMHYFMLASFTWMGLEAVHMYFALVKVFNVYVPSYMLKFSVLGWGVPLVIVSLVLAGDKDAYGSGYHEALDDSEPFCWLQADLVFYLSVVAYVLLVLICNSAVFGVVLVQIRNMQANKPAGIHSGMLHDLRGAVSLTLLLGLTWIPAFLTWGPARVPLLYLFAILNSLQGFLIFVFHCLMKENVRKQWRVHLCCGRFRLNEYSDWSRSMTVGGKSKQNQMGHRPSVKSSKSDDSNDTRRTSNSSNSGQRQADNYRSSLDLVYENPLELPRAHAKSPPPPLGYCSFPTELDFEMPNWPFNERSS
ncbi:hypothetical protein MATL_G00172740 [Megalops atlanticus]|uniref:Adhesion G-protein coupled receptor G4-like n=1 Tax=Megalops atlanticus TaxID=7932 RepID=A0A9D3PPM0_MEGAT|nr:hypothetical protein MATL_G00172740 [Megalops atlanticus]